jgi:MFS family permease
MIQLGGQVFWGCLLSRRDMVSILRPPRNTPSPRPTSQVVRLDTPSVEHILTNSTGSGIPTAGRILGSILTPFIADRFGRRGCMMIMSAMFIVAVIIEVTANSFWQIVIGRFLNYIPMVRAHILCISCV